MFLLTISLMRLMGKSSIVQLTPYDLVAIIILGTVVAEPLISTEFLPTIIRAVALVLFYIIFAKLSLNQIMNRFLLGEPSILIKDGQIIEENLEKEHLSLLQLLSILRTEGYSKLTEIDFAVLEPTGSVSVIPIPSARPVTLADLDIEREYEGIPMAVIIDGIIQKRNLKLVNRSEEWLLEKLKKRGIDNTKDIFYAFVEDKSDRLYLSLRDSANLKQREEVKIKNKEEVDNFKISEEDQEIYLIKDGELQLKELANMGIDKSELLNCLGVKHFDSIEEVKIKQKLEND